MTQIGARSAALPLRLWIGLALIAICWPLNWLIPGPRTHWLFFPLWLGYSLAVDGLVFARTGTSLIARDWRAHIGLFALSAPAWWLFEAINARTQNWEYVGRETFTNVEYAILASLSFSTVMPAVFGTAELVASLNWVKRLRRGIVIHPTRAVTATFFAAGWIMLALLLAWPRYFFPFVWMSVFFILEPINIWRGCPSVTAKLGEGDWRPVIALWLGTLICGFFWEFWNWYSFPRWIYHIPYADFLRVFEMPLLGYGGYLPFGMELVALYYLVASLLGREADPFIQASGTG